MIYHYNFFLIFMYYQIFDEISIKSTITSNLSLQHYSFVYMNNTAGA